MNTQGPPKFQPSAAAVAFRQALRWGCNGNTLYGLGALIALAILGWGVSSLVSQRNAERTHARDFQKAADFAPTATPSAMAEQAADFNLAPESMKPISYDEARAANAAIPLSTLPIQAARPFIVTPDKIEEYARALDCMTAAIYYEAASETYEGQAAVAQVVLNRARHPAYPKTVCGVVFQGSDRTTGCQFSFTCDGAMARPPSQSGWLRARAAAGAALNGSVAAGVGMATHYHTDWVSPYWSARLVKIRQIGTHIFYRWPGTWGMPAAFTGRHPGVEPIIAKMSQLASLVELPELAPPLDLTAVPTAEIAESPRIAVLAPLPDADFAPVSSAATAAPPALAVKVANAPPPPTVMANPLQPPGGPSPSRRSARIPMPD